MAQARKIVKGLLYSVFGMGRVALTACGSSSGTAAAPASSPAVTSAADGTTAAQTSVETADKSRPPTTGVGGRADQSDQRTVRRLVTGGRVEERFDRRRAGSEADCPLSAADIGAVTSMTWQFEEYQAARPLESDETVMTTVCGFTAPDVVDEYGDPAFLRTDVFTGADAAKAAGGLRLGLPGVRRGAATVRHPHRGRLCA